MENHVKKWFKRLSVSITLAIIGLLLFGLIALAIPDAISDLIGVATDTTISLTWTKSASTDNTIIRQSTTTYPTTVADGTSTYNGTASYANITGLTAGTTYYFSAWGFDGSDYSATAANLAISTLPSISDNTSIPFSPSSLSLPANTDPDTSGWSISPLDDILSYFADPSYAHSGLGMPVNNVIMFIAGVAVTFLSLGSYIKWRSFWTSWAIAIILCSFFSSISIMQWMVVGFLILAGAGVWAIEKTTQ